MSKPASKELLEILRFYVYDNPRRSDRWIKQRSLYDALSKLLERAQSDREKEPRKS